MIRRPPRSTQGVSSAASDVYKRQVTLNVDICKVLEQTLATTNEEQQATTRMVIVLMNLSLIHISEPTRPY